MDPMLKYALATGILVPAVGVGILKWRRRVEIDANREDARLRAEVVEAETPIKVLERMLDKRDAELAKERERTQELFAHHLATATEARGKHIEALMEITKTQQELRGEIEESRHEVQALREEERKRAGLTLGKLEALQGDMDYLHGRLDGAPPQRRPEAGT